MHSQFLPGRILRTALRAIFPFIPVLISCGDSSVVPSRPVDSGWSSSWRWENPRPQGQFLYGIWGSAADDVYAVGDAGVIVRFDGTSWNVIPSGTGTDLENIWGKSPLSIFVVGDGGLIRYFDGAEWTAMSSRAKWSLHGVFGVGPGRVYAVGDVGTILRYVP